MTSSSRTVATLGLIFFAVVLYLTRYLALTALIGVGLGVIFVPIVNGMKRRFKVPKGLGGFILLLAVLGVFASIGVGIWFLVSEQVALLQEKGPELYDSARRTFFDFINRFPFLQQVVERTNFAQFREQALSWAAGGLQTGLSAMAGLVLILALAIFTAIRSDKYLQGMLTAFPAYKRDHAKETFQKSAVALRTWFKAQLIDMVAVGVVTGLGLLALGVDYWAVLGLIAGILDIIPYVGPFASAFVSCLITLGSQPDKAIWVLGLFFVIQQLEGNILIPVIMKGEADLPEVPLIVLIMFLSSWFGLLGALIAAPVLAVGRAVYLNTYKKRMDQKTIHQRGGDYRGAA